MVDIGVDETDIFSTSKKDAKENYERNMKKRPK